MGKCQIFFVYLANSKLGSLFKFRGMVTLKRTFVHIAELGMKR